MPRAGRRRTGAVVLAAAALAVAALVALGNWQMQRRAWKLELVERVQARLAAPAVPAPGPAQWPAISAARDEYRRVQLEGRFLHERQTLVHATTALGMGYWVMTPLRRDDGTTVLVNRGFVASTPGARPAVPRAAAAASPVRVTGLLRMSEPAGLLRRNEPAAGRWYARDVAGIAAARGLGAVAPYFVDAAAPASDAPTGARGAAAPTDPRAAAVPTDPRAVAVPTDARAAAAPTGAPITTPDAEPVPGLTVVRFRNDHLAYAMTWYALAALLAGALAVAVHAQWRSGVARLPGRASVEETRREA